MRNTAPKKPAAKSARELHSLISSFTIVRILHYAAQSISGDELIDRLHGRGCRIPTETLNRTIRLMARRGWLRTKGIPGGGPPQPLGYALTKQGQKVLDLARRHILSL